MRSAERGPMPGRPIQRGDERGDGFGNGHERSLISAESGQIESRRDFAHFRG